MYEETASPMQEVRSFQMAHLGTLMSIAVHRTKFSSTDCLVPRSPASSSLQQASTPDDIAPPTAPTPLSTLPLFSLSVMLHSAPSHQPESPLRKESKRLYLLRTKLLGSWDAWVGAVGNGIHSSVRKWSSRLGAQRLPSLQYG